MNNPENAASADPYRTTYDAASSDKRAMTSPLKRIGRYRVDRVLGEGSFGLVYLAHDDQLDRSVAIKVPHSHFVSGPGTVENFLAEAHILASLDHPNIVPVFDFGRTDDGLCYVVSKLIAGRDLASTIKQSRLPVAESARMVAVVADALQHAHLRGLVHRDIKPANILIRGWGGMPFVCDFGLALRAEALGKGARLTGSPAYMSPEQARGEGHLVDGRSDLFNLGVVLYELLTGRLPFQGASLDELLEQITTVEPRPPRQVDDTIPIELERICLKALAKPVAERYATALDMAEDLQAYLSQPARPERTLLEIKEQGSVTILSLNGNMDYTVVQLVWSQLQQLLHEGKKSLVVDCSEMTYIASAGLRILIQFRSRGSAIGSRVALAAVAPHILDTFSRTVGNLFEIFPTVEAAVKSFQEPPQS